MATGQQYLSPDEHRLRLDFSNSIFERMQVRVYKRLVATDLDPQHALEYAAAAGLTKLVGDGFTEYDYGEILQQQTLTCDQEGGPVILECDLAPNRHTNMIWQILVQCFDPIANQWIDAGTRIYQDAAGMDKGFVYLYQQRPWGDKLQGKEVDLTTKLCKDIEPAQTTFEELGEVSWSQCDMCWSEPMRDDFDSHKRNHKLAKATRAVNPSDADLTDHTVSGYYNTVPGTKCYAAVGGLPNFINNSIEGGKWVTVTAHIYAEFSDKPLTDNFGSSWGIYNIHNANVNFVHGIVIEPSELANNLCTTFYVTQLDGPDARFKTYDRASCSRTGSFTLFQNWSRTDDWRQAVVPDKNPYTGDTEQGWEYNSEAIYDWVYGPPQPFSTRVYTYSINSADKNDWKYDITDTFWLETDNTAYWFYGADPQNSAAILQKSDSNAWCRQASAATTLETLHEQ